MTIARPTRTDGFGLGLIATGAVSIAAAAVVAVVRAGIDLFQPTVTLPMPVSGVPAAGLESAPGVVAASYDAATIAVSGASAAARSLLLLEAALPALATVGVCALAWWLGVSLIRSRPFRASMSPVVLIAACLVIAGGLFGQIAGAFGRALVADGLVTATPALADVLPAFRLDLDLAPLGWGFALALVAMSFRLGARMQRDTEGLV